MISIIKKEDCCGCSACVQICPKQCISFREDEEGFCYPVVDSGCIDCGLCERVCPLLSQNEPQTPSQVYAAYNQNLEERINSSSGGIFILLAKKIIEQNGVVFGAKWDGPERVVHGYAEDYDGIKAFQGSKYLQSIIGTSYIDAERFLKQGRQVLFSGTPCQIAGLKLYLHKNYDNLLTVEVICHGVPSPLLWRDWVKSRFSKIDLITDIRHRSKRRGWSNYCLEIKHGERTYWQYCDNNDFFRAFYANLSLRPSCYNCPVKCGKSRSDIALGDLWGVNSIEPSLYDDLGTSSILVYSANAEIVIRNLGFFFKTTVKYESVVQHNPSIEKSSPLPKEREPFYTNYNGNNLHILVLKYCENSFHKTVKRIASASIRRLKELLH